MFIPDGYHVGLPLLEGLPYPTDEQRKRLRSKTLNCHTDFRRCNVLTFLPQFPSAFHFGPSSESRSPEQTANGQRTVRGPSEVPISARWKPATNWTLRGKCRLLVRSEPGVMCICRCCRDGVRECRNSFSKTSHSLYY